MTKARRIVQNGCCAAALTCWGGALVRGQAPTVPTQEHQTPGSVRSTLGPIPGAGGNPFGMSPGTDPQYLGGRAGTSSPRVPTSITQPGGIAPTLARGIIEPSRLKITDVPLYGPLELPDVTEEEGPPDGLTLDQAVARLLSANLGLAALRGQIPTARADVLTASLRANPILYADSQLVPYGTYNKSHPGGPNQYDVNMTHPIDYSGKRRARTESAEVMVTLEEALYQNAARITIDNLYTAFVDVLAARETTRYAQASVAGLTRLLEIHESLFRRSDVKRPEVERVRATLYAARLAVLDSEATYQKSRRTLGLLLNHDPSCAETLQIRGRLADLAPPPPAVEVLSKTALEARPDLAAQRLGLRHAETEWKAARANRFGDAYLLYQPYTFQNNTPVGAKSATSWALGATVALPIFNRNQGGVLRARLNIDQTGTEAVALERRVAAEVADAERRYQVTREQVRALEHDLLPAASHYRDDTLRLFVAGGHGITAVENSAAQKDYNHVVRLYRDALIRHRRAMLALNTAVGRNVLP
jgi:outer membrane protein, heavy metal efflux system